MSKKTASENLSQEFAALPLAFEAAPLSESAPTVILARMVHGLSPSLWQKATENLPLGEWHVIPIAHEEAFGASQKTAATRYLPVSPFREARGILATSAFLDVLQREIARLARMGGSLSVISAAIANREEVTAALGAETIARLDASLAQTLLDDMDICDGLGLIREGVFICSLPGLGQLAARRFAENCSQAFTEAARPYLPKGGLSAGKICGCAFGIVNIMQGDACKAGDLVKRARDTLEVALTKEGMRIHQETAYTPLTGPTLVHSSEKRFLFFGGDPK